MMFPFLRVSLALACLVSSASAADMLVARWTFNDGQLKSDIGGYVLRQIDNRPEPTLTLADGQAQLGPRALLVCDQINSKDMPALAKAVTIWARIRIDAAVQSDAFPFGLRDVEESGGWKNMVLTMLARPEPPNSAGFFSRMANGRQVATGSRMVPIEPGRFISVALVMDGASKTVTYVVDGESRPYRHGDATELGEFTNLAIGRLKTEGLLAFTIDELRVYSVALPPEWVAEISAVK